MNNGKDIVLTGTQENLETIFDKLVEIGLKKGEKASSIGHVHVWLNLREVSGYYHTPVSHRVESYKVLNANLPSHRKHVKKIAKELVKND